MSNEKMKILEMIESKVISPEEGLKLLNAMDQIENSTILPKETIDEVSEHIHESLNEAEERRNEAFEELNEELEEMAEEIEEEVDEMVEDIEESYEDIINEEIDPEAEEVLRAKVEEIKEQAERLKEKIKVDININGEHFKRSFYSEDFKKNFSEPFKEEFKSLKRGFKGDMKSFNKDIKRFGQEMSKLGQETAGITKEVVDELMGAVNDINFQVNDMDFKEEDFTDEPGREARNYSLSQEFSIDLDGKTEVSLNTISTDIILVTEEREDMLVHYINYANTSDDKYRILVEEDSKKVKLTEKVAKQKPFFINFTSNRKELLVRMPRKYKDSLSIKTVSGDLDMNYLDSDAFRFSSVSGDMKADIIYSVNSLVKTTSGDCHIDLFRGNMMFTSVSGDVNLRYEKLDGDFTMKSVSGDGILKLPKNSEFEVISKSVSGDVDCEFPLTIIGTKKRGRLRGRVGSEGYSIMAGTTSGDLSIKRY